MGIWVGLARFVTFFAWAVFLVISNGSFSTTLLLEKRSSLLRFSLTLMCLSFYLIERRCGTKRLFAALKDSEAEDVEAITPPCVLSFSKLSLTTPVNRCLSFVYDDCFWLNWSKAVIVLYTGEPVPDLVYNIPSFSLIICLLERRAYRR